MRRFFPNLHKNTSLLGIVFLFCSIILLPGLAQALSISPVRIEFTGDPGQSVENKIKVINTEPRTKTFFTNIYNFEASGDESGNPAFKVVKSDLATWISVQNSVTLDPNETKVLPFSVAIPANAEPGGYFAAIFLTENPPQANEDGQVTVGSEVGTLLLLRVNGDIKEGADILEFGTKDRSSLYQSLPISFYYRFQNSGQDRVKPFGDIVIKNWFGRIVTILPANKDDGNVLPQSIRRFENTWGPVGGKLPNTFFAQAAYQWKHFALGHYNVRVNLAYGGVIGMHSATASTGVWVLPWQFMLVALVILLFVFFIGRFFIKRYNRWIVRQVQNNPKNQKRK